MIRWLRLTQPSLFLASASTLTVNANCLLARYAHAFQKPRASACFTSSLAVIFFSELRLHRGHVNSKRNFDETVDAIRFAMRVFVWLRFDQTYMA